MVDLDYVAECHKLVEDGQIRKLSPYFVPRILPNLPSGHVSIAFGLRGPNHTASTACASGAHAIGDAFRMVRDGDADVMVCGGVEACISPLAVAGFCRARALSTRFNQDPTSASRPFDRDRDGFVIGEGAGLLVLEELKHAQTRSAKIYAEVLGYGLSGDAHHVTAGREDAKGALQAMKAAFSQLVDENAIVDLWHVNAHATSTHRGDVAELRALRELVQPSGVRPLVSSNKGAIGHLLGAAGSAESIFAIMAMKDNLVPKNFNLDSVEEGFADCLDIVTENKSSSRNGRRLVLKNSFGFGGTNASLLFSSFVA